jgi:hypothetical protein
VAQERLAALAGTRTLVAELHQEVARLLVTQRPCGFAVIPATRTRRVANSMKNKT